VMVVDDDPDALDLVKRVLERCHAQVTICASGAECVKTLGEVRPTVLITDIGMPGMDGYSLMKAVRALPPEAGGLSIIQANQELAQVPDFKSILDFGSGAGRVTRWFRAAYPNAQITTADLRERDLDLCVSEFGSTRWVTSTDLQRLEAPQTYDLVWMGSVLTHLSADNSRLLMQKAMDWCNDKGLYVTSFHGRYAYSVRQNQYYVPDLSKLPEIEKGFETSDYGYADYPDSVGYGVSFTDPSWVISQAKKLPCRIIAMGERVWDSNHDVLGVQHVTPTDAKQAPH
jgi:CheY-like chemotaxis protein